MLERRYKVDVRVPLLCILAAVSALWCLQVCSLLWFPYSVFNMCLPYSQYVHLHALKDTELRVLWLQHKVPSASSSGLWLGLAWGLLAMYCARRLLAGWKTGVFLLDFSIFPIPKE